MLAMEIIVIFYTLKLTLTKFDTDISFVPEYLLEGPNVFFMTRQSAILAKF